MDPDGPQLYCQREPDHGGDHFCDGVLWDRKLGTGAWMLWGANGNSWDQLADEQLFTLWKRVLAEPLVWTVRHHPGGKWSNDEYTFRRSPVFEGAEYNHFRGSGIQIEFLVGAWEHARSIL